MIQRIVHSSVAVSRAIKQTPVGAALAATVRNFSDNITYSGGQPGVQGGFYGAGGARSQASAK